jgi:hypothetical protein
MPEVKVVYVLIAAREKFDQTPLPAMEHRQREANRGHVLSKVSNSMDLKVVFQHWLENID